MMKRAGDMLKRAGASMIPSVACRGRAALPTESGTCTPETVHVKTIRAQLIAIRVQVIAIRAHVIVIRARDMLIRIPAMLIRSMSVAIRGLDIVMQALDLATR